MERDFFVEIDCQQICKVDKFIYGDVFVSKKIMEEGRTILVLADGMGSGVKANVLASLTASMAINFASAHKDIVDAAQIIMRTLPICSVRQISYCTFTIVDIDFDGVTKIVEYDNPPSLILRNNIPLELEWQESKLTISNHRNKVLRSCSFKAHKEDRILFWSDGIMQSGLGSDAYPLGWRYENAQKFVLSLITTQAEISAHLLAKKVVNRALTNDTLVYHGAKDDISCAAVYFREPRHLLICSGPPFEPARDFQMAMSVLEFKGKKIVCGGTTSDIIARELQLEIKTKPRANSSLPPSSKIEGIDLVTEGVLTLSKVATILESLPNYDLTDEPADEIVKLITESDYIHFLVGTGVNISHHAPDLPIELELRKSLIKQIIKIIESRFLKQIEISYL